MSDTQGHDYVFHHSVALYDFNALDILAEKANRVILPGWEIDALTRSTSRSNGIGWAAAQTIGRLEGYRRKFGTLMGPVPTQRGGELHIELAQPKSTERIPTWWEPTSDNNTILLARNWREENPGRDVILVTRDPGMRIRADAINVKADDWWNDEIVQSVGEVYSGIGEVEVGYEPHEFGDTPAIPEGEFLAALGDREARPKFLPNQGIIAACPSGKMLLCVYLGGRFHKIGAYDPGLEKPVDPRVFRGPARPSQMLAYELLSMPSVEVVTLMGEQGTGKSSLALLAGLEQTGPGGRYDRIVVWRTQFELDKDMGALPGTVDEKFSPHTKATFDAIRPILRGMKDEPRPGGAFMPTTQRSARRRERGNRRRDIKPEVMLREDALLIEPINFLQGRTIVNSFVILEEAQNATPEQVRHIVGRIGVGSKLVIVGDPTQKLNPLVSPISNGLVHTIMRLKDDALTGHITLRDPLRSKVSMLTRKL